ncbi:MAG TPA: nicotinamide riboside transporter PnuC [Aquabacterium sp.]|nr:nicotinamide riboside transporter PnuC [Aquabacterium sp.]
MAVLDSIAASLAWADPYLTPWWTAGGVPVSRLEALAFVLSLWMVACNLRVNPLGWPLAIASSALYGVLFARSRLYGEATLQLVFIVVSAWGWWQWLRGVDESQRPLRVRSLSERGRRRAWLAMLLLWPTFALVLGRVTDSDVPWGDALPTAGSLIGQWLLARKWLENWTCWLWVNLVSMGLFAYKQLWLTVILYGVFAALSAYGWRAWRRQMDNEAEQVGA